MTYFYILSWMPLDEQHHPMPEITRFVTKDDAEMQITECIMQGRKWRFFVVVQPAAAPKLELVPLD